MTTLTITDEQAFMASMLAGSDLRSLLDAAFYRDTIREATIALTEEQAQQMKRIVTRLSPDDRDVRALARALGVPVQGKNHGGRPATLPPEMAALPPMPKVCQRCGQQKDARIDFERYKSRTGSGKVITRNVCRPCRSRERREHEESTRG